MRVTLHAERGHWAELKERLTWAERNRIRDAAGGDGDFFSGFATTLCKVYVSAWDAGVPLDDEGWAALDGDYGDAIFREALSLWKGAPDPKATAETSSSS